MSRSPLVLALALFAGCRSPLPELDTGDSASPGSRPDSAVVDTAGDTAGDTSGDTARDTDTGSAPVDSAAPTDTDTDTEPESSATSGLGGRGLRTVGGAEDSEAGQSLSAGDTDGDGVAELVVGAPGGGRVWVLGGGEPLPEDSSGAAAVLSGEGRAGSQVVATGDLDGDGLKDVVVVDRTVAATGDRVGAVHKVHGPIAHGTVLADVPTLWSTEELPFDQVVVDAGGDADGDGVQEVVLGNVGVVPWKGVYVDGPDGPTAAWEAAGEFFDQDNISTGGDHDGDGLDDLVAKDRGDPGGLDYANLMIIPAATPERHLVESEQCGDSWGAALYSAADLNGDGVDDLIVGDPGFGSGDQGVVGIFLYPFPEEYFYAFDTDPYWKGIDDGDLAGTALAVGDWNDDGYPDVAIGAPGEDTSGEDAGAVYLFFGPLVDEGDLETADDVLYGDEPGERAGTALFGAADLDGDGVDDLAVGSPGAAEGRGAVTVVPGTPSRDSTH